MIPTAPGVSNWSMFSVNSSPPTKKSVKLTSLQIAYTLCALHVGIQDHQAVKHSLKVRYYKSNAVCDIKMRAHFATLCGISVWKKNNYNTMKEITKLKLNILNNPVSYVTSSLAVRLVTFRLQFESHRGSFASNLEQVANLPCAQVNSASCPQQKG